MLQATGSEPCCCHLPHLAPGLLNIGSSSDQQCGPDHQRYQVSDIIVPCGGPGIPLWQSESSTTSSTGGHSLPGGPIIQWRAPVGTRLLIGLQQVSLQAYMHAASM